MASRLHRAIDGAVRWRLGLISMVETEHTASELVDPEQFWAESRVDGPSPLVARPLRTPVAWTARTPRAVRARMLELTGESRGPGDHWGATSLRARLALHPNPGAPLALVLHGYAIPAPWWEDVQMQQLLRRGMSAVRLDLPFHLTRRVPGSGPGSGFFSSDLGRTSAVLRQSVEDCAAIVAWARAELGARVGVFGVSLGGLVGGLLAARVPMDSAILITPACDLVEIILELAPHRVRRRLDVVDGRGGRWAGDAAAARTSLEETLAPVLPRRLTPVTDPSRIILVAADHDQIVGSRPVEELAAAWGVECWRYGHGHITVMTARGLLPRLQSRLAADLLGGAMRSAVAG